MNSCEKFRNMICIYTDGELGAKDEQLLFEHIKTCHECKVELDMMQKTRACLKNMPVMPLPEGFIETFRQNLTKDEEKEAKEKVVPFYRKWRTYTSVAAVILFVFVLRSGLTDKNILISPEAQPKQNITSGEKLSAGENGVSDLGAAPDTADTADMAAEKKQDSAQVQTEEVVPYMYFANSKEQKAEEADEAQSAEQQSTAALPETASEVPETAAYDESGGVSASSGQGDAPKLRAYGGEASGGGGGSSAAVYQSVYRTTENIATVFVKSADAQLATALFDITMYTPAEIESMLSRNGITDFSIKTPLGDFEGYYVNVQITE